MFAVPLIALGTHETSTVGPQKERDDVCERAIVARDRLQNGEAMDLKLRVLAIPYKPYA